jgi:hypothetical protein
MFISVIKNATCSLIVIPGIALSLRPRHPFLVLPWFLLFSCLCFTYGHKYTFYHLLTEHGTICMVSPNAHCSVCQWLCTFQCCLSHLYMLWRCKWSILYDFTEHIMCYSKILCEAMSTECVTIRYDVQQQHHLIMVIFCDQWRQQHGQHANFLSTWSQVAAHIQSVLYLYTGITVMNYGLTNFDIFHKYL